MKVIVYNVIIRNVSINPSTMAENKTLTLASALDTIVGEISSSTLDVYLETEHQELTFICDTLDVTPLQACLFAVILEKSGDDLAYSRDLISTLSVSKIRILGFKKDFDELATKRLVVIRKRRNGACGYRVSQAVITAIQENAPIRTEPLSGLSTRTIFARLHNIFADVANGVNSSGIAAQEIYDIMNSNPENQFVQASLKLGIQNLKSTEEKLIMFYMVHRNVSFADNEFEIEEFRRILDDPFGSNEFIYEQLCNGGSELHKMGLVEFRCENGLENHDHLQIPEQILKELLSEIGGGDSTPKAVIPKDELVSHSGIRAKSMFYNDEEGEQVRNLTELLMPEKFAQVQERLATKGYRTGFCALCYGCPGSGKTETVLQIAKATGRDIFMVDMAIKSKWIGESEKNLRQIFKTYRNLVKESEVAPILLFNEADAIFGKRLTEETGSEKLNNTLQNILLQEMENLDGILIATTNMTENFDAAFERRFLYKIHFKAPSTGVKAKIWKSMIDEITETEAERLAAGYNFTGGQIENISRKLDVDYILSGTAPDMERILTLCSNECIQKQDSRRKVGF